MRRLPDGTWQYSPKDLIAWLEGDFAAWCEREAAEIRSAGGHRPPDSGRSASVTDPPPDSGVSAPRTPDARDDEMELAVRYGLEHERRHLERLRAEHPDLVEIDSSARDAAHRTREALARGASVIFQAVLEHGQWRGIADFLHRSEGQSCFGAWCYHPWDTKLARSAKPYFLLQLCTYAGLLEAMQQHRPARLGFILGDGSEAHFRTDDFWHYYRRLKRRFEEFQRTWDSATLPDPGADRSHGRWTEEAARILADRDDLSLVANISRSQVIRLREVGITTLTQLGEHKGAVPQGFAAVSFEKLREQAAMQLKTRREGAIAWSFRAKTRDEEELKQQRGLELLPPPSRLDVFYDIEGFPYAPSGLEYLQGASVLEPDGSLAFHDWWAHSETEEKRAFEAFIDWVYDRWQRDPAMHIYHYAGYERTAISRLSTKYATREYEVDQLLRHDVLVDLFTVVRQGMVIGTPSYSLKDVEHLYLPPRQGDVLSAGASVVEYQRWIDSGESGDWRESPILAAIRDYNRVDCESTVHLRNWLLERQREAGITWEPRENLPDSTVPREKTPAQVLAEELLQRAEELEGEERRITQLLAWLLEFHRRDDKPMWWRFFERLKKDEQELYDDQDCLAGVTRTDKAPWQEKRSLVYEFAFDADQETRLHEGSKVKLIGPETSAARIETFDGLTGLLTIKRGTGREMPSRFNLIPDEHVSADPIPAAIEEFVRARNAGDCLSRAVDDLLHRRPPRLRGRSGGPVVSEGGDLVQETIAAVRAMDGTTLAIQGPPGTGKTTTAAHVIAALLDDGKRVGIVANGHAVVNNLLAKIARVAPRHASLLYKVGGEEAPVGIEHVKDSGKAAGLVGGGPVVVGGTAWLFARPDMRDALDYLFVDEAGQVSLANVVGSALSADNLVLIGDQMQLAQPVQGDHPGESGSSCLEYLLQEHQTIPPALGVLLNRSYRMHPDVCRFISDAYYEGRLESAERTHGNRIDWDGLATGVTFVSVAHEGRAQCSDEEVAEVKRLVDRLVGQSAEIEGEARTLTLEDILIVAPFNAQVRALKRELPAAARVGTVDKFQGQEAPVVIVSMCASTLDDAPRGAGFLLEPNRLNVAISRAQALALVVGSPRLGDVRVRSVEEMRLVNGWCRVEGMS